MDAGARNVGEEAESGAPAISVVVASHDRPIRLRWLLNALEEQTLDRGLWEVVVGHDSGEETEALLREHPLAADGALRHVSAPRGTAPPGANRNAAWRVARAPLIVFTDDDCRPPPDWLGRALAAAEGHPGAIIQGRTERDPDEWRMSTTPHHHSQYIHAPPSPHAEACNIVYPRELLERLGGFNPRMQVGEDTDLALRARRGGAEYLGAREMLTYHAVHDRTLASRLRWSWRWRSLPALVKAHPEMRRELHARLFWKATHVWLPLAVGGGLLARRRPGLAMLAVPWVLSTWPDHGSGLRGRLRSLSEIPGCFAVDATEVAALCWGSARHRTVFL